jgi:hypothetical protein
MKPIPLTAEILAVATSVIWFESPEEALEDPVRFMAYAMTHALPEDMRAIRRYVSDDDFREALDNAPPGIIDPRSWAYWNSKMGRYPPPPMPKRRFAANLGTSAVQEPNSTASRVKTAQDRNANVRRQAVQDWLRMREHRMSAPNAEEVRHRAAEEWSEQFGPQKKT